MSEPTVVERQLTSISHRLSAIEVDLAVLKSSKGHVALGLPVLVLIWSIMVVAAGGLAFVIRLDTKLAMYSEQSRVTQTALLQHVSASGHPVAMEKYERTNSRLDKLEKQAGVR